MAKPQRKLARKAAENSRDEDQLVQMNFRVTDELQQRIKIFAVQNRKTVREVLTEAFQRLERSGL